MSAYSAVNGVPDSANSLLLQQILRDRWGFKGYVVSDCGAIWDILGGHKFAPTVAAASAAAVKAGCDLECGNAYASLTKAVQQNLIDEKTIDKSVERLFEARIRLGMFDPPAQDSYRKLTMAVVDSAAHRKLALEAAREAVVLLKNDGLLPLSGFRKVAVIGPNADDQGVPLGNYNGTPSKTVTVLGGLKSMAPTGTEVRYAQGSARTEALNTIPVPASALKGGVHADFFLGQSLSGKVVASSDGDQLAFDWGQGSPVHGVPSDDFSARFTTTLIPPTTGEYRLGVRADDGARLKLDGKTIVEEWNIHAAHTTTASVHLEAGRSYKVDVEYYEASGLASVALVWAPPGKVEYSDALDLARWGDVAVLVLGISGEIENEELDRADITLPKIQQGLLDAVLATGKPVVVVLESGSCLAVDDKRIHGIVQAWYPGEEGGTAVAEVLFGKTNPSGRLPVTFYRSLAQVPDIHSYKMDGRTYRYFKGDPLYAFGHGLSYTQFAYTDLRTAGGQSIGKALEAAVTVKNVGVREGDEVVQMYASRQGAAWPEPIRRLVAFQRIHLNPGESKRVHLVATAEALGQADADGNVAIVPGQYEVTVGGGQPGYEPASSGKSQRVRARW
jgi:beta-glucosidase